MLIGYGNGKGGINEVWDLIEFNDVISCKLYQLSNSVSTRLQLL